ncbi:hypothetical protein XENTR_v10019663 [Xenopus tropicalis]|nr:hypothetical protein XENTR_v10019663 [Xenopus tropicalis]
MEVPLLVFCCSMAISSVISAAIDYRTLRIGGLVFAGVLFILGILIILSRKCRCKFNQHQRTGEPLEEEGTLRASIRRMSSRRL